MKVGTLVQVWHDTGACGVVPVYGVVTRDLPCTFEVMWERGRLTLIRKARPNGVEPVKAFNTDTAREVLASRGVTIPRTT